LSVNDLRWIRADQTPNFIEDYDGTSRYLFESGRLVGVLAGEPD